MALRICESRTCNHQFEPVTDWQKFCTEVCGNRERVARYKDRKRAKPNGPGGGGRQRTLFPRTPIATAKPPQRVAQKELFSPVRGKRMAVSA